jgi:hypothetical protein
MEILLDLIVILLAPDTITLTGRRALSLVGLKAHILIENVVGFCLWVLGLLLIVCVMALAIYCWSKMGGTP